MAVMAAELWPVNMASCLRFMAGFLVVTALSQSCNASDRSADDLLEATGSLESVLLALYASSGRLIWVSAGTMAIEKVKTAT